MFKAFGRYLLLEPLAEGGSARPWLATEIGEKHPRALVVKRLRRQALENPAQVLRLRHEALIAVAVDHDHVVRVEGVGTIDGEPYLVERYLFGWTVAKLLEVTSARGQPLPVGAALRLIGGALEGLEALHNARHPESGIELSVVHRDITPRNLIVEPAPRLVIIDLGLGKSNVQEWATQAGRRMGTPRYMAPEQAGGLAVDLRADLYAVAVVCFELLTLTSYLERNRTVEETMEQAARGAYRPVSSLRPEVPAAVDRVLERALSVRVDDRFGSAKEMRKALEAAHPGTEIAPAADCLPEDYHQALRDRTRHVDGLLEHAKELGDLEQPTRAEVWATRPRGANPLLGGAGLDPTVTVTRTATGSKTTSIPPPAPATRARLGLAIPTGIAALGLGAWFVSARLFEEAPTEVTTASNAVPFAVKTASAPPVQLSPGPSAKPETEAARHEARPPPRTTALRPRRHTSVEPPPEASADEVRLPSTEERITRLMSRASELKRERPDLAEAVNHFLGDVALFSRSTDPPPGSLEKLERQLVDLSSR
jgi:serine/threonine-protein kinase